MWVFNQLFTKVEATKPPASRNVSAEIFVVCRGYKAPQKLDPKFLDPRSVFEELPDQAPNAEAKIFHPEKRKRYREGYEEDEYTFYREISAMAFVETQDPIQVLSATTRITWDDEASRRLRAKEVTTKEIAACTDDLKVLGKKDFRNLLKWRLAIREELGLATGKKDTEVETPTPKEVVTVTEDDQMDAEMERMAAQDQASRKRDRRKLNERKRKEILRMQMGMLTPHELGLEQDAINSDEIFGLKRAEQNGAMQGLLNGAVLELSEGDEYDDSIEEEKDSEDEVDDLEEELDTMYEFSLSLLTFRYDRFQERKAEANAKYRAKRAREEPEEWDGITNEGTANGDSDSESEFEEEMLDPVDSLLTSLGPRLDVRSKGQMSKRATLFFDRPEFAGLGLDNIKESVCPEIDGGESEINECLMEDGEDLVASENEFQQVRVYDAEPELEAWDSASDEEKPAAKPSIDIITAEAMTLAHQLATRQKTKSSIIDDSYNRWTFSDRSTSLPTWFTDDESRHNTPQTPITAAAAEAIKAKLRALNARPIKKIAEAKARKKIKAVRKLNKVQKKADVINENGELTEKDKAGAIAKLMAKARGRGEKKRSVQVVVAHGKNRGISGRPKGVKGRYKMVDPRMKKEKRALKRAGKKSR
jgi:AdoMet-dependent rRNA methyltransferase SPB1